MTKSNPTPSKKMISVRLPNELVKRIDACAAAMNKRSGVPVKRSFIVETCLERGLIKVEKQEAGRTQTEE